MEKSRFLSALLILLFLASYTVRGEEYKKTITEKYDVRPGALLKIENKFGDMVCQNWDKMAIEIEVNITVHSSSQEKANDVFDKIKVAMSGNESVVTAITTIDEMKGTNKFSIDYTVNMPADISVELYNKYGTMIVAEVKRSGKIDMKYGDLKVDKLWDETNEVWVKYGNADIGYINQGKIDAKYIDLDIEESRIIEIDSKYNEVTIEKVDKLNILSGYDDISIDHVGSVKADAKFSVFEIELLEDELDIEMEYGGCQVDQVLKGFSAITILAQYAGIEIEIEEEANYQVSVDVSYSGFDYPGNSQIKKTKHSHTSALYEGYVGSNPSASSKVMIKAKHGGVELK